MKRVLVVLILFLCLACSNGNRQKEEMTNFIKTSTVNEVMAKLDELKGKIQMFPEEKVENDFIYLVEGIKENVSKFSQEELKTIEEKLNFNYSFSFNSVNFSKENFLQVVDFIKEKVHK